VLRTVCTQNHQNGKIDLPATPFRNGLPGNAIEAHSSRDVIDGATILK
jgi:hypothetical protein